MSAAALSARRPVLADLIPGERLRDLLLVLGSACFVGAMAQVAVPLPGTPVPVTGQTLAVLCAGAALGPGRALGAMALYAAAAAAGVPWLADGEAGWGVPSFGYVVGFLLAAAVVGALSARGADRRPLRAVAAMLAGTVVVYAVGVPWLAASLGVSLADAVELGLRPFVAGDVVKVALAAGLLPLAWRLVGGVERRGG